MKKDTPYPEPLPDDLVEMIRQARNTEFKPFPFFCKNTQRVTVYLRDCRCYTKWVNEYVETIHDMDTDEIVGFTAFVPLENP